MEFGYNALAGTGIGQTPVSQNPGTMLGNTNLTQGNTKSLTFEEMKNILDNAPEGTDRKKLIKTIIQRGYTFPGLKESQEFVQKKSKLDAKKQQTQPVEQPKKTLGETFKESIVNNPVVNATEGLLQGVSNVGQNIVGKPIESMVNNIMNKITGKNVKTSEGTSTIFSKETQNQPGFVAGKMGGEVVASEAINPVNYIPGTQLGTVGKLLLNAAKGVSGMTTYTLGTEQRLPTATETAISGLAGPVLQGVGALAKKIAPKLQLSGLLNPAKLTELKNKLILEGDETTAKLVKNPKDVGNWMIARGMNGSKETIINKLDEHGQEAKKALDTLLQDSTGEYTNKYANQALSQMVEDVGKIPGLEEEAIKLQGLIKDKYTLSELNQVKRSMDEFYNIYKQSGETSATLKAKGLDNIRKGLKTFIENAADAEGLGNIKMLNNEISMAYGLKDAISKKESADVAREIMSFLGGRGPGAIVGGTIGAIQGKGDWKDIVAGAVLGGLAGNTAVKTKFAGVLSKLTGMEQKAIGDWIATKGTKELDAKVTSKLNKIVGDFRNNVMQGEAFKEIGTKRGTQTTNKLDGLGKERKMFMGMDEQNSVGGKPFKQGEQLPQVSDDLIQEARKYKSADEFVKNKGIPIYHGSNQKIKIFSNKKGAQGVIWFTDNPKAITSGESGAQGTKFINERITTGKNFAGWDEYEKYGLGQIEDMGYDGIKLPTSLQDGTKYNDYILFNNKTIKTESQLKQIREEANK